MAEFLAKLDEYFKKFDTDNSNTLDKAELTNLFKTLFPNKDWNETELDTLFKYVDKNNDGEISFEEFKSATIEWAKKHNK